MAFFISHKGRISIQSYLNLKKDIINLRILLIVACYLAISANIIAQPFNVGHTTVEFYDFVRNRNIETEIYYPATTTGENVPIANGSFPVLVFGHGFLMDWDSYENYWTELVPEGYVMCFPTTEMGISPSHENFGGDLKFVANQMQLQNNDASSLFFNSLTSETGLMGHSMGGGASFLAATNDTVISTLINFAAAETNPSAIYAAENVTCPTLIFSGGDDCVTPSGENQSLMYDGLASDCKTHINIDNGGHCYFANYNFNCALGETVCNPTLDITREEQQDITMDFLKLWLDYSLNGNQLAFEVFNDSLMSSNRISFDQFCNITNVDPIYDYNTIKIFPNPAVDKLNFVIPFNMVDGLLSIYNINGNRVFQIQILEDNSEISISEFPDGGYVMVYNVGSSVYTNRFVKADN